MVSGKGVSMVKVMSSVVDSQGIGVMDIMSSSVVGSQTISVVNVMSNSVMWDSISMVPVVVWLIVAMSVISKWLVVVNITVMGSSEVSSNNVVVPVVVDIVVRLIVAMSVISKWFVVVNSVVSNNWVVSVEQVLSLNSGEDKKDCERCLHGFFIIIINQI